MAKKNVIVSFSQLKGLVLLERIHEEIKPQSLIVRIFPNEQSCLCFDPDPCHRNARKLDRGQPVLGHEPSNDEEKGINGTRSLTK